MHRGGRFRIPIALWMLTGLDAVQRKTEKMSFIFVGYGFTERFLQRAYPAGRHDGRQAVSRCIELLIEPGEIVERRMARGVATVDIGHQIGVHETPVGTDRNERDLARLEQLAEVRA